jgi:dCMP deaminase
MTSKRTDYISWNQYFMGIALLSAQRSKDSSTQVGACIINQEKKIVGIGYNGFPSGISDEDLPWDRKAENPLDTKYPYVCHSELNAILNSTQNLKNCTLYVTLYPCNQCTKMIIQSGIKKVVYADNKYSETDDVKASKKMLDLVGIETILYKFENKKIMLNL